MIEALQAKDLQMHDDVIDMSDLFEEFHDEDSPLYDIDLYNAFQAAKVVHDIGFHHSGFKGHVLIGGQPAPDVAIECLQNAKKNTSTDLLGYFEEYNFKPGLVEFKFTKGALVYNLVVKMERGKVVQQDINLDQVTGTRGVIN